MKKLIVILCSLSSLTACVGPLLNHDVGRSIGDGNHSTRLMTTPNGYFGISYDYGVTENFDLGVQLESLNLGIRGKYSFINEKQGLAMAGQLGTGSTFGGDYTTAGLIGSYAVDKWEPFGSLKYTKVSVDETELRGEDDADDIFATIPGANFDYVQAFAGTKYWFKDSFALSFEVGSFIISDDDEVEFDDDVYFSVGADFAY